MTAAKPDIAQQGVIIVSTCTHHSPWQPRNPISHGGGLLSGTVVKFCFTPDWISSTIIQTFCL